MISQLCALERRSARGGRDTITHPPNGWDDVCNAVAGLAAINTLYPAYDHEYRGYGDNNSNADREAQVARYQRQRMANYIYQISGGQIWPD